MYLRHRLTTGKVLGMTQTALQFIDAKGGPAAVARATGYKPGAVALWRHRNKLPRTAWPEIVEAFGVTLDTLLEIETASASVQDAPSETGAAA